MMLSVAVSTPEVAARLSFASTLPTSTAAASVAMAPNCSAPLRSAVLAKAKRRWSAQAAIDFSKANACSRLR